MIKKNLLIKQEAEQLDQSDHAVRVQSLGHGIIQTLVLSGLTDCVHL